jgi:(S)-2-hydroxy-acid oxidase
MSGDAPNPVLKAKDESPKGKILCIADLEEEGSTKLPMIVRGKFYFNSNHLSQIISILKTEHYTKRQVSVTTFLILSPEFFNSGSTDQETIRANSASLNRLLLRSRVLVDVSACSTKTTLWGKEISFPLGVAPAGLQGMAHPIGEIGTSRACAIKGVPMAVSSFANSGIQNIRDAAVAIEGGINAIPKAMQLYTMRDLSLQLRIIRRAEAAGCKAIFLTADSPVLGVRYNEWRNDFRTPEGLAFPNLEWSSEEIRSGSHDGNFSAFCDNAHSWERDIPYLRSKTNMEIWIKGVLCAEDVERAVKAGCDGVIISNHGGRQLDGVPATIDALPACVAAARGRIHVHVDGGFRRGADIFRALALGAEFVWVGRPAIWGLAVSTLPSSIARKPCFANDLPPV